LHQYIDTANNHNIDNLLKYVENSMQPGIPYNKWDDPEFVTEMEELVKSMENGTDKGHTWEEVKETARQLIKAKTAK
jgi:hypothetical protein